MKKIIILAILTILLIGCKQEPKKQAVNLESPFVGGAQGLQLSFENLRKDVFDGGTDPFDVVVRLENKGETLVPKENVRVKLSGINPAEFSKTEAELTRVSPDDVIEQRKTPQGQTIAPPPAFVEFTGMNYKSKIAGATTQYTLRAEACYLYKTKAVSKICVREDLLNPETGGICEINQDKPVHNSGSPVQATNFKESTRSKDRIGFTFDVRNAGTGNVFERAKNCDRSDRKNEDRVYVTVNTGIAGLQCTALESTANGAAGWTTLYGGIKTISCTQPITTKTDFEQLVNIELSYDYEQSIQTTITVKSSGEQ
ncbi:hypothetical protein HY489_04050 [Candidatus Woesearchaeota archaeon]|nr:hypothetical protein [Candidatus Woesearchaeota archaeon]